MIAEAVIVRDNAVLMVKQHVQRGDIVWNFPGGGIECNETAEQACIREAKEETGYHICVKALLQEKNGKYTYVADIIGGELHLDRGLDCNGDLIEVALVSINDVQRFDAVTAPILELYFEATD